jgi:hypothetical protein
MIVRHEPHHSADSRTWKPLALTRRGSDRSIREAVEAVVIVMEIVTEIVTEIATGSSETEEVEDNDVAEVAAEASVRAELRDSGEATDSEMQTAWSWKKVNTHLSIHELLCCFHCCNVSQSSTSIERTHACAAPEIGPEVQSVSEPSSQKVHFI